MDVPNSVWTGDIPYIWTEESWLYLAVVIDLFNRQVIGFAMSNRMTRALVMDALRMAWFRRRPALGLIFHSDRGSQGGFNRSSQHPKEGGCDGTQVHSEQQIAMVACLRHGPDGCRKSYESWRGACQAAGG